MTKKNMFMENGYYNQGLFILNILDIINNDNASSSSAYLLDFIHLWHGRLGHVSIFYIQKMKELGLIFSLTNKNISKCKVYVESKITKKSCKLIERISNILDLSHTDPGNLKQTMTRRVL